MTSSASAGWSTAVDHRTRGLRGISLTPDTAQELERQLRFPFCSSTGRDRPVSSVSGRRSGSGTPLLAGCWPRSGSRRPNARRWTRSTGRPSSPREGSSGHPHAWTECADLARWIDRGPMHPEAPSSASRPSSLSTPIPATRSSRRARPCWPRRLPVTAWSCASSPAAKAVRRGSRRRVSATPGGAAWRLRRDPSPARNRAERRSSGCRRHAAWGRRVLSSWNFYRLIGSITGPPAHAVPGGSGPPSQVPIPGTMTEREGLRLGPSDMMRRIRTSGGVAVPVVGLVASTTPTGSLLGRPAQEKCS